MSQAIAQKRKAHLPKNQITDLKKIKPYEGKETEKNKDNKQGSDVNEKKDNNKDRPLRDSFYKCTCEGKLTVLSSARI